jgi:hypothetical protein
VHDPVTEIGNGEVPDPDFPTYKVQVLDKPTLFLGKKELLATINKQAKMTNFI